MERDEVVARLRAAKKDGFVNSLNIVVPFDH